MSIAAKIADIIMHCSGSELDLSRTNFYQLRDNDILFLFDCIPPTVTSIDLSFNSLYYLGTKRLKKLFAALPAHITSISLHYNALFSSSSSQCLCGAFSALPPSISSIDLGYNALYESPRHLISVFRQLKPSVTSMSLEGYRLFSYSPKFIKYFLKQIPSTVLHIDLSRNFHDPIYQYRAIGDILLSQRKHITIGDHPFERQLKQYLKSPFNQVLYATKNIGVIKVRIKNGAFKGMRLTKPVSSIPIEQRNVWFRFFGARQNGSPYHPLSDIHLIKSIHSFI